MNRGEGNQRPAGGIPEPAQMNVAPPPKASEVPTTAESAAAHTFAQPKATTAQPARKTLSLSGISKGIGK